MAVDASNNLYFENQIVSERVLINGLIVATQTTRAPLTLIIHADKSVSYEILAHLSLLARDHGITNILLATLPLLEPGRQTMSHLSANSTALPPPPSESWLPGPKPSDEGWTRRKFAIVLVFVLAFHIALIFLFGTKQQIVPRPVTQIPHLQLANNASEFIALGDPTLFARPNAHDLVTAFWRQMPAITPPGFDWTGAPRYQPPSPETWGAPFRGFVQNSRPPEFPLNFKPEPKFILPAMVPDEVLPGNTTMQFSGDLARRGLLHTHAPPSLPLNEVILPSQVQALVDTAGNVASAVVLQSSGNHNADQLALRLAGQLRFAPAPRLMFGEITFNWHTVPTNTVPATLP